MRNADTFENAPCLPSPEIWESTDQYDHELAASECAKCPAFEACERLLEEVLAGIGPAMLAAGGGPTGTWAGRLVGQGDPKWANCGRESGYYNHRRHDEDPCGECWEAHSVAESARYQRRKKEAS